MRVSVFRMGVRSSCAGKQNRRIDEYVTSRQNSPTLHTLSLPSATMLHLSSLLSFSSIGSLFNLVPDVPHPGTTVLPVLVPFYRMHTSILHPSYWVCRLFLACFPSWASSSYSEIHELDLCFMSVLTSLPFPLLLPLNLMSFFFNPRLRIIRIFLCSFLPRYLCFSFLFSTLLLVSNLPA